MKQTSIVRAAVITALAVVTAGCGGGSSPTASNTGGTSSSSSSSGAATITTAGGGGSGGGTFRTGHATIVTPSETINLSLDHVPVDQGDSTAARSDSDVAVVLL